MNATTPLGIVVPAQAPAVAPVTAAPAAVPLTGAASSALPGAVNATSGAANATGGAFTNMALPGATGVWGSYLQAVAWLCFIIAMLWLLVWLFKKARGNFLASSTPTMSIESRLALGPKKWVIVARFLDRRLVLGVTDHQITLLTELGTDDDPEKDDRPGKSFASLLKTAGRNAPEQHPRTGGLDIAPPGPAAPLPGSKPESGGSRSGSGGSKSGPGGPLPDSGLTLPPKD